MADISSHSQTTVRQLHPHFTGDETGGQRSSVAVLVRSPGADVPVLAHVTPVVNLKLGAYDVYGTEPEVFLSRGSPSLA